MFLDFYKIREQPFGETPDPRYLHLSPTHREAIASLAYGLEARKGFLALVAEPGMGKTTLVFHLLEWLRESARTVFLFQTQCDSHGLLCNLLSDLGMDTQGKDLAWMHERLKQVLINEAKLGRRVVVFIDEAQNLSESALETVRLLSDFESPRSKLIEIVLVGQPGLADKLALPAMAQLRQRISILARLSPFTSAETDAYINHRLSVAGSADQQLFTPEARAIVADTSMGIPRNINNLCFGALSLGYAMGKYKIDGSLIREVISDLDVDRLVVSRSTSRRPGELLAAPKAEVASRKVLSIQEASRASEGDEPSRHEVEPVVTSLQSSNRDLSSVLTLEAPSSRRTMVSLSVALFAFSVVGAFGISFHGLTQPVVSNRTPTPSRTANQTQNSIAAVRPMQTRSKRYEKKVGDDFQEAKVLTTPMPMSRWQSMQGIFAENLNMATIPARTPRETTPELVGSDLKKTPFLARIAAAYPPEVRQSGVEGEVIIDAMVDATGKPTNLRVLSGPALLRSAALDSLGKWQLPPSYFDDRTAPMEIRVAVEFRLVD